jgi:hypothetical protein
MSLFGLKYKDKIEVEKMIKDAEEKKNPAKKKLDKETTTNQQILILHYLGLIDLIQKVDILPKAKIISMILNRSDKNVYDAVRHVAGDVKGSKYKTKTNLLAILPLIEEIGLPKAIEKIKADIAELKKD